MSHTFNTSKSSSKSFASATEKTLAAPPSKRTRSKPSWGKDTIHVRLSRRISTEFIERNEARHRPVQLEGDLSLHGLLVALQ